MRFCIIGEAREEVEIHGPLGRLLSRIFAQARTPVSAAAVSRVANGVLTGGWLAEALATLADLRRDFGASFVVGPVADRAGVYVAIPEGDRR